jgi:outer membrane protein TolC
MSNFVRNYSVPLLAVLMVAPVLQTAVWAGEPAETSLRGLIETAERSNPELLAAREAADAARFHPSVAGGYPDPLFTYTYFFESIETRLGPQRQVFRLTQPIPFPGKLSSRSEVASYDAAILEERYNEKRLEVRRRIIESYYAIASVKEILSTLGSEDELLVQFEDIVKTRLEAGRGNQQDILKVQIERVKLQERRLKRLRQLAILESALNELIHMPPGAPIVIGPVESTHTIDAPLEQLRELALARPTLRSNELRVEQRRHALSLAKRQYYPDLMLGLSYFDIGKSPMDIPDSGKDAWNVSVGVRIPLWFGKTRSGVKENESAIRHLEYRLESEKSRTLATLEDLYTRYTIALDMMGLYETDLIPRAEQSLESAQSGFMAGDVDFLNLLDSERLLLELRISLAEKKAEVEKEIAMIEEHIDSELVVRE